MMQELQKRLTEHNKDKLEIFQIDESIFDGQDAIKTAWCLPNERLRIPQISKHHQKAAMIGAISSVSGKFIYQIKGAYFNQDDIIEFINKIRNETLKRRHKIAVFWDNASIHKSKVDTAHCKRLGIEKVFNIPYSP